MSEWYENSEGSNGYYKVFVDFRNGYLDDRYPKKIKSLDEIQLIKPTDDYEFWALLDCLHSINESEIESECIECSDALEKLGLAYIHVINIWDFDDGRHLVYVPVIKVRKYDNDNNPISSAMTYYYSVRTNEWIPRSEIRLPKGLYKFAYTHSYKWFFNEERYEIESINI